MIVKRGWPLRQAHVFVLRCSIERAARPKEQIQPIRADREHLRPFRADACWLGFLRFGRREWQTQTWVASFRGELAGCWQSNCCWLRDVEDGLKGGFQR